MLCYQDRTFCGGDGCAKFARCMRALTPEVQRRADEAGLPIAQFSAPSELDCWRESEDETDETLPALF